MTTLISMMADKLPLIPGEVQAIIKPIMLILMCLLSIAMIIIVVKQSGDPEDLGAITGGNSESYYSKNKGSSKEGKLRKATIWIASSLVVLSVLYFLIKIL